jgi:capsular polysaccharide biosynthesis protein
MTLAMLVVLVFEMLDDTIKNPDEIRQRFHQPVLGIIPRHNLQQDSLITLT